MTTDQQHNYIGHEPDPFDLGEGDVLQHITTGERRTIIDVTPDNPNRVFVARYTSNNMSIPCSTVSITRWCNWVRDAFLAELPDFPGHTATERTPDR